MKRFLLFVISTIISLSALGQSISKQINDIKRSSHYITAEATMETEAKAYELAQELLGKQIAEYASEQKSLKKAPNVIVKDVAGKAEKMQMNRGSMVRVFLYVKKNDIIAADNTRILVQNVQTESQKSGTKSQQAPEEQNPQATTDFVPFAEPIESEAVENASPLTEHNADIINDGQSEWKQNTINEILQCNSVGEAKSLMDRLRTEMKIKRYGAPNNCKNPEKCYWLIFDEQENIITVLGTGSSERTNFRTKETDTLVNYSGKGAIWFTFAQ